MNDQNLYFLESKQHETNHLHVLVAPKKPQIIINLQHIRSYIHTKQKIDFITPYISALLEKTVPTCEIQYSLWVAYCRDRVGGGACMSRCSGKVAN